MKKFNLEICADSIASALTAQSAGAQRIEFCDALSEGGATPSFAQLEMARKLLKTIQLYVLIRPRGGDFLYSDVEFDIMKLDVHCCGKLGCDGVVIGMLTADGNIDVESCAELVAIARQYKMGVTFHRAFDRCRDLPQGLEDIIGLGCERILTSGGYNTAEEGIPVLKKLVEQAAGRISIMPGAGVTPENVKTIIENTGVHEIHGTFRSRFPGQMLYRNPLLSNPDSEYTLQYTDIDKVKKALEVIAGIV